MTARHAARHRIPKGTVVTSPYSAKTYAVIAAREVGCHVELVLETGRVMLVDAAHKLGRER